MIKKTLLISLLTLNTLASTYYEWGLNIGLKPVITNLVMTSANSEWTLGLKDDKSIIAWGSNRYGQTNTPPGNNYIDCFAGWLHGIALRDDGTVVEWGTPYGKSITEWEARRPAFNNAIAVAAGDAHSIALLADGTVMVWGERPLVTNWCGKVTNTVAIASGWYAFVALHTDGTVTVHGGTSHLGEYLDPPPGLNNVVKIGASQFWFWALKSNGEWVAWGAPNDYGQLTQPSYATNLVSIGAGRYHVVAARADGSVIAWGDNSQKQCNLPTMSDITFVSSGRYHSQAIKNTIITPPPRIITYAKVLYSQRFINGVLFGVSEPVGTQILIESSTDRINWQSCSDTEMISNPMDIRLIISDSKFYRLVK